MAEDVQEQSEEMVAVLLNRREEALKAGMSQTDALEWATSLAEVGLLRHLVELNCPGNLLFRILN